MTITNDDIFKEVRAIRKDLTQMSGHAQILADHEARIRRTERFMFGALGTGTLGLGAGVADLIVRLSQLKH